MSGQWVREGSIGRDQVLGSFPLDAVCDTWARILVEDLSSDTAQGTLARNA
jgi:hypothetical protein